MDGCKDTKPLTFSSALRKIDTQIAKIINQNCKPLSPFANEACVPLSSPLASTSTTGASNALRRSGLLDATVPGRDMRTKIRNTRATTCAQQQREGRTNKRRKGKQRWAEASSYMSDLSRVFALLSDHRLLLTGIPSVLHWKDHLHGPRQSFTVTEYKGRNSEQIGGRKAVRTGGAGGAQTPLEDIPEYGLSFRNGDRRLGVGQGVCRSSSNLIVFVGHLIANDKSPSAVTLTLKEDPSCTTQQTPTVLGMLFSLVRTSSRDNFTCGRYRASTHTTLALEHR